MLSVIEDLAAIDKELWSQWDEAVKSLKYMKMSTRDFFDVFLANEYFHIILNVMETRQQTKIDDRPFVPEVPLSYNANEGEQTQRQTWISILKERDTTSVMTSLAKQVDAEVAKTKPSYRASLCLETLRKAMYWEAVKTVHIQKMLLSSIIFLCIRHLEMMILLFVKSVHRC